MAHALLFTGPEGIGKRALALELAKALECESFPDLMEMEAESREIGVDPVRAMERWANLAPLENRWKAAIVPEAERLSEEATHALLKTLEEPPPRTLFLLLTASPQRLPATLLSRCQRLRCAPQGVARTASALQELEKLPAPQARWLAVASGGRMGLALRLARNDALNARNALLDQFLDAWRGGQLEMPAGKQTRREVEEGLEWIAGWWRDLLLLAVGGDPAWIIHQDRVEELKKRSRGGKQSPSEPAEILLRRIERTYEVQEAVQRNANLRTAWSVLLSSRG